MDPNNLRTLKIFEEIEKEQVPSQRDLARVLNISLGLVNSFIKRLTQTGYLKLTTLPKSRTKYVLTPKGIAEKTRLTYEFIQYSFEFYRDVRQKLRKLFRTLMEKGVGRIVFYGVSDLAEIAYISLQETPIEIVGVADDRKQDQSFFGLTITGLACLNSLEYDAILITVDESTDDAVDRLKREQISADRIVMVS